MHCHGCSHWVCERRRQYGDGTVQTDYVAPEGKGHCDVLGMETAAAFGCLSFAPGGNHVETEYIDGAPWERWAMVPCPDCEGRGCTMGGRACQRCSGTAKVRRYDDGYVADETWLHPKERERRAGIVATVDPGTVLRSVRGGRDGILS
jgi:hypothetical protein